MEFKVIEKAIDPMVLGYFKNNCYEKKYDRTEITDMGQGKFGRTYRSVRIYKNTLNEDKYRQLVREYYINTIQPTLEAEKKRTRKRAKKEIGKNVTQEEFLKTIFRKNFEHRKGQADQKGRRINMHSFLVDIEPQAKIIENKVVAHSFEKMLQKARKYGYFTPNMFISYQSFAKELLTLLGVIILDFDLDKVGMVLTKEELFKYIKKKIKVEPSMIWDTKTKGNYQVAILIEPMTGTPKSVHLYEQVVKEMIYKLGSMCDLACYNANHLFSMAQNNKHKKRLTRKYNDDIHDISEFRWLLHERDERRKKEAPDTTNIIDFTREGVRRDEAIQALFNGEVSWRNHACFTLGLVMRFLGYSEEETENYILGVWVPAVKHKADHPFTNKEAMKCVQHAFSGKYRCFHSNWVEAVTGIDCNLKGFFRGYSPYQSKGIYVTDTEIRFKEFLRKNGSSFVGTIPEIMDELKVKRRTLIDVIDKLRDNGELNYQSQRGRYAKTTFTLIEKVKELPVIQIEAFKPIEEQLMNLSELENAINEMNAM